MATFREFVEEHCAEKVLPTLKPSAAEIYRVKLQRHLLPYFDEMRLCVLQATDVQAFVVEKAKVALVWNMINHLRNLVRRILRIGEE